MSRAAASASRLTSVPMPAAFGSSVSSASSSAPEPVPRSAMRSARLRGPPSSIAASAASTTVSVSGRGTSVASLSRSGRPQNSLTPRMRATGSRSSRRAASAASACAASSPRRGRAFDRQRGVVEAERMADQQPRVELGRIQAGLAKRVGQRAARLRDGHARAATPSGGGIRRLRPPAARPDAR